MIEDDNVELTMEAVCSLLSKHAVSLTERSMEAQAREHINMSEKCLDRATALRWAINELQEGKAKRWIRKRVREQHLVALSKPS